MLVQCNPRLRSLRMRHRKTYLVVFVIFLVFFLFKERQQSQIEREDRRESDTVVALKAKLGYLKSKIAKQGISINVNDQSEPTVYVVTPTYNRPVQKAELTRLCHTFLLVENLHWIVVEDAKVKTKLVSRFLSECGVPYTHLSEQTPPNLKIKESDPSWRRPKGVQQRNEAIYWIRDHVKSGVLYFGDDDNTYSLQLFDAIRHTKKVSVFPVGLVGGLMVEKPKLSEDGSQVVGWGAVWSPSRPFALDMAGFAVNIEHLLARPKAKFAYRVKRGYQESEFLKHLTTISELEPLLPDQVLVWHTRSEKTKLDMEKLLQERLEPPSDQFIEV